MRRRRRFSGDLKAKVALEALRLGDRTLQEIASKHQVHQRGINRRFVVTNRDDLCSQSLYDHYTNRGQTENFIKAFKNHLSMDQAIEGLGEVFSNGVGRHRRESIFPQSSPNNPSSTSS